MNPNPWDILIPYIEKMDAAALERLGELVGQPIIDWYLWIDEETGEVHYA